MNYDVIGDIHGQADKLEALLAKMGYSKQGGLWIPPKGRQAIFLGDLIDRGPKQLQVLETVRTMIDAGHAQTVMGNHEFNAIGYVTPNEEVPGEFLRKHSDKNKDQHREFLRQVGEGSDLHNEWVNWFRTLPPFLDLGGIRVVHAFWHQAHVDLVSEHYNPKEGWNESFLHASFEEPTAGWMAMEALTKGLEVDLPEGHFFVDQSGIRRTRIRTKWWLTDATHYREIALMDQEQLHRIPDIPFTDQFAPMPIVGAPVFVGHYWMTGTPSIQTCKVACLDYSAAKDGPLVAYRWDGETELDDSKFVFAGAK